MTANNTVKILNQTYHLATGGRSQHLHSTLDIQLIGFWKTYNEIPKWFAKTTVVTAFVLGACANTFILLYFFKSGKYRVPLFTLFSSLAITDWITCSLYCLVPAVMFPEVKFSTSAALVGKMVNYISASSYGASVLHLVFLAALRYYQLCYPLKAKVHVTATRVMKVCLSLWVFGFLIYVPIPFYRAIQEVSYKNQTLKFFIFTGNSELKEQLDTAFSQVIPLCVIILLHFIKLHKLHGRTMTVTKLGQSPASSRTAVMITIAFIFSLIGRLVHNFYHGILGFPYHPLHILLNISSANLLFANSIVNPFLYIIGSADIRKEILKTVFKCSKEIKK